MSPGSVLKDGIAPLETPRPDQRRHPRYPIRLDLQYKLLNHGPVNRAGSGRTVNISTGGIFFEAEDSLPLALRSRIELMVQWPFLLEGRRPLKLVLHGWVVRSDATGTAVQATTHEFRTSKRPAA